MRHLILLVLLSLSFLGGCSFHVSGPLPDLSANQKPPDAIDTEGEGWAKQAAQAICKDYDFAEFKKWANPDA